ncbi:hypothetical protein [Nibricoccus sp. IMCC34717]|uniref:phage tail fiber protein n=1 Tax=Nibricoccus sp. IMCC34717 TaxID=3034021 RepID=UPI00384EE63C
MPKSTYLANKALDLFLSQAAFAPPATLYVALYTVAPTVGGGGTEVAGNGYARVAVTNNATNFPAASAGAKSNGTAITFPNPTGSWGGAVVAVGLLDASSGGNLLYFAALTDQTKTFTTGDTASFAAGSLQFTET